MTASEEHINENYEMIMLKCIVEQTRIGHQMIIKNRKRLRKSDHSVSHPLTMLACDAETDLVSVLEKIIDSKWEGEEKAAIIDQLEKVEWGFLKLMDMYRGNSGMYFWCMAACKHVEDCLRQMETGKEPKYYTWGPMEW